jgi:ATP-dependent DNA helicase RecG
MEERELKNILSKGEGISVEFKEAKDQLPKNLFETICAFLNTEGGKIILGVDDNGSIIGIDPNSANKMKSDLANLSNNQQKIDPVFMLSTKEIIYNNKYILIIDVPTSSLVHKSKDIVYARNEEGDYKVTTPEAIAAIVNRKQSYFTEQRVYSHISFRDFEPKLFERARRLIQGRSPGHPWTELTNNEFLHRSGFFRKAPDGTQGYTLASVLLFGKDETIQSVAPAYKIDALLRKQNLDRYDDRLIVRTNLIDAYDLLMGFIAKHLNDPFYLEGDIRISLRDKIFRELVANIIAHREYLDARPATIIIYENKVIFENPNIPHGKGILDPKHFTPFSKNPIISKFMLQTGRVEEVGSGIRNVNKYLPLYAAGGKSEFIEDDLFVTKIYLEKSGEKFTPQVTPQVTPQATPQVERLVSICNVEMGKKQLMSKLKLKDWKHFYNAYLKPAIVEGLLEMTIPDQPNHPNQKYRLTERGKQLSQKIQDKK